MAYLSAACFPARFGVVRSVPKQHSRGIGSYPNCVSRRKHLVTSMAMPSFEFATANQIIFGCGSFSKVAGLLADGAPEGEAVLVVTGSSDRYSEPLVADLNEKGIASSVFKVSGEPSVDTIIAAIDAALMGGCRRVVSVGGGSAIDTGKAVAALLTNGGDKPDPYDFLEVVGNGKKLELPGVYFVAVPTTAGPGAEVTRNAVIGAKDRKVSMRSPFMLPDVAVVDPELTKGLPGSVTASTGLDAFIQCVEPFVSNKANPVTDALALSGMKYGAQYLFRACENGAEDMEAREGMCICSLLGGLSLANAKLGIVHGFAGVIGGMFPAPHGSVCAALLVPGTRMNLKVLASQSAAGDSTAQSFLDKYAAVAAAVTGNPSAVPEDGLEWMEKLVADIGVPGLSEYGLGDEHVTEVCEKSAVASSMQGNPVQLSHDQLSEVLRAAM